MYSTDSIRITRSAATRTRTRARARINGVRRNVQKVGKKICTCLFFAGRGITEAKKFRAPYRAKVVYKSINYKGNIFGRVASGIGKRELERALARNTVCKERSSWKFRSPLPPIALHTHAHVHAQSLGTPCRSHARSSLGRRPTPQSGNKTQPKKTRQLID